MAFESDFSAGPDDLGGSYSGTRWSKVYARPPQWLLDESPAVINWYKANVYDFDNYASIVNSLMDGFRSQAAQHGIPVDQTDAKVLQTIGELAVGEITWDQIVAVRHAANNPLEAAGDRYVPATTYAPGSQAPSSINVGGAAVDALYQPPANPGGIPIPGQQDAYGTVTTMGLEGSTAAPHPAVSGPPGTVNGYANGPSYVGGASGFSAQTDFPGPLGLLSSISPLYIAAAAGLLFIMFRSKKGSR